MTLTNKVANSKSKSKNKRSKNVTPIRKETKYKEYLANFVTLKDQLTKISIPLIKLIQKSNFSSRQEKISYLLKI